MCRLAQSIPIRTSKLVKHWSGVCCLGFCHPGFFIIFVLCHPCSMVEGQQISWSWDDEGQILYLLKLIPPIICSECYGNGSILPIPCCDRGGWLEAAGQAGPPCILCQAGPRPMAASPADASHRQGEAAAGHALQQVSRGSGCPHRAMVPFQREAGFLLVLTACPVPPFAHFLNFIFNFILSIFY